MRPRLTAGWGAITHLPHDRSEALVVALPCSPSLADLGLDGAQAIYIPIGPQIKRSEQGFNGTNFVVLAEHLQPGQPGLFSTQVFLLESLQTCLGCLIDAAFLDSPWTR